jgi:hypothetical protein
MRRSRCLWRQRSYRQAPDGAAPAACAARYRCSCRDMHGAELETLCTMNGHQANASRCCAAAGNWRRSRSSPSLTSLRTRSSSSDKHGPWRGRLIEAIEYCREAGERRAAELVQSADRLVLPQPAARRMLDRPQMIKPATTSAKEVKNSGQQSIRTKPMARRSTRSDSRARKSLTSPRSNRPPRNRTGTPGRSNSWPIIKGFSFAGA